MTSPRRQLTTGGSPQVETLQHSMGEALERIDMKAHRCASRGVRAAMQRATPVHNTAARNQSDNQTSGGSNVGDVRKQRMYQNAE